MAHYSMTKKVEKRSSHQKNINHWRLWFALNHRSAFSHKPHNFVIKRYSNAALRSAWYTSQYWQGTHIFKKQLDASKMRHFEMCCWTFVSFR